MNINIKQVSSKISRLNLVSLQVLCMMLLIGECFAATNPYKPGFWVRDNAGIL
jgi:hypothetical protein